MSRTSAFIIILFIFQHCLAEKTNDSDFYAYYTKVNYGEPWERHSLTSKYADLIIKLPQGEVIFHRASSYLPKLVTKVGKWDFDEVVERSGDGSDIRPDKNNIYSYVRLIENNSDSIVVHWRYFPQFTLGSHSVPTSGNVDFDGVVHEYFIFFPDGKVRRIIREGTKKLNDWQDPANRTVQHIHLNKNGINVIQSSLPSLSKRVEEKIKGTFINRIERDIKPAYSWHFDEGLEQRGYEKADITYEEVSKYISGISGPKTVWKAGVSGSALAFDGYNSKVKGPIVKLPKFGDDGGFSVEAWVAPGAYSICKWTAIAHQSKWEADVRENIFQQRNWGKMQLGERLKKGYFLGIDEFGRPTVIIAIDNSPIIVTSTEAIPINKWSHVAFTYVNEGMLYLYVNGELIDFVNFSGHVTPADNNNFVIGKNDESIGYVSQHVVRTYSTFPSPLGFDGLIDEVNVYQEPLWHKNIQALYQTSRPEELDADLQSRILPGAVGQALEFGASYTHLKYHELWDNIWREPEHPDIVVKFDLMPTSVVFWRGSRSPGWVTETNKWISDQSAELTDWHWDNKNEGAESCSEHMSDYQGRHSHVRIIENTDARVVIHWRYASVDVLYKHPNACRNPEDWGVWTDEYLTIYPDGVGVRLVDMHEGQDFYHSDEGSEIGFHDTQFLSEAGTKPEDNINLKSLTIVSSEDKITELDWSESHPDGTFDAQAIWINLKSDYKVFEIFPPKADIYVWASEEKTSYSKYSAWNHYPVTQAPCDGRFSMVSDRVSHSALGAVNKLPGNMLIYGFTNKAAKSLIPLARSWNFAPDVIKLKGGESSGYDKSQRAYQIATKDDKLSFVLDASKNSPLVNPSFVLAGWDSKTKVKVDGAYIGADKKIRQGLVRDTNGELQLVVWMELTSEQPVEISFVKE
ncbi:MAG: hypothetical protein CBE24_06680 [bacterium TMED264]|nr:MAG: hypothetical protein CBE24_06680 [bacterium TMED264]